MEEKFDVAGAIGRARQGRQVPQIPLDSTGVDRAKDDPKVMVEMVNYALAHLDDYITATVAKVIEEYDQHHRQNVRHGGPL